MLNKRNLYILIAVISFAVYYNSLSNSFVFDDESVVQTNPSIQTLSNIPKFFTADEGFHKVIGRYYRPLVSTLYAVDYAIWGLDAYGFHLTNVLIHVISCLLLLAVLLKLFGDYKYGLLAALIGALIFAVHPIHTEAVSWVSGRTDSLVTLFFFASLLMYINFTDDESRKKWLYLSLLFYALGLLSKEMIVTMPVFILLYDFVYRKKNTDYLKQNIAAYASFIVITLIFVLLRYLLLKDIPDRTTYFYFYGKDFGTAFFTMLKTIPIYFKLLIFPVNLLYHYNGTIPDSNSLLDVKVIISVIFIAVLFLLAAYFYKKHSVKSFCILSFFVSLMPVMNIIPTMNFMAERFLYMTSFALTLIISYIIVTYLNDKNKNLILSLFIIIAVIFSYLTLNRNKDWKDNDTLYSTADGIDGSVLLVNAGNIYANKKNYDEAEKRYRKAIEIRDNSVLAHHNLGLIFLLKGNIDSAEIQIKKGLEIDSLAPDGYFQLSNIYERKGRIDESIKVLEKLQTFAPNYRNSGEILTSLKQNLLSPQGIVPDSLKQKGESINQIQMLEKRSYDYYKENKYKEAIKDLTELVKISPAGKSGYYNNIALCYEGLKDNVKSKEYYIKALTADENNVNALGGMAEIYLKENNKQKAIENYKKILKINPSDENAGIKLDSLNKK
ncbi:MAG: tetratricopeptide repeat protein [Ignavibacteria bacterium]|nr:tetratricopeptide repeat protein [Ignavibacteria bacterium]